MKFKEAVHSKKGNYFSFYLFYSLYIINDLVLKNRAVSETLWDLIKLELFYIDGGVSTLEIVVET